MFGAGVVAAAATMVQRCSSVPLHRMEKYVIVASIEILIRLKNDDVICIWATAARCVCIANAPLRIMQTQSRTSMSTVLLFN